MKRKLMTGILVAIIVLFIGVGAYAWFSSTLITKSNKISTGELSLNSKIDESDVGNIFKAEKIIPGEVSNAGTWSITNTGTMNMKLKAQVVPSITDRDNGKDTLDKSKFEVKPTFKIELPSDSTKNIEYEGEFKSITELENELNNQFKSLINNEFIVGQNLILQLDIRLNNTAGNDYQGSSLDFTIKIIGDQIDKP